MIKTLKTSMMAVTVAGSLLAGVAPVAAQAQERGGDRSFQSDVRNHDSNTAGVERRSGDRENWGDRDDRDRGGWGGGWRPGYGYGYGYGAGAVIAGAALGAAIGGAYSYGGYYNPGYYGGYYAPGYYSSGYYGYPYYGTCGYRRTVWDPYYGRYVVRRGC